MTLPVRKTFDIHIVICDSCKGKGYRVNHKLIDYHKGDYEINTYKCRTCEGSGRLEEKVTKEYFLVENYNET